jgi:outer membrane protein assembly factor BamD (BamD/ComL family)
MTMLRCWLLFTLVFSFAAERSNGAGLRTDEDNARYLLEKGESSLLKGDSADALERFGKAAKRYKGTQSGAAAQIRVIEIEETRHRWVAAFDACQEYFESFPGSLRFLEVLESQIRIALRVQKEMAKLRETAAGKKGNAKEERTGLPDDESLSKMFRLVLANGAHTDFEPEIRYGLAVALEREERPKSARAAYAELIEYHRDHPLSDDAAFQIGYIDYKKVMKGEQGRLFAAQLAFVDFLERYAKSEKVAQARYCLEQLSKREAASLLSQARYYEGLGKADAALIYYDRLFRDCFDQVKDNDSLRKHVVKLRTASPEGEIRRAERSVADEAQGDDWLSFGGFGNLDAVREADDISETTTIGEAP